MQAELAERIELARSALRDRGLAVATDAHTPIFMLHFDAASDATGVVQTLRERGFYCCVSTFPAVPMNKPSIRFTVSRHNSLADLELLIDHLADISATPRETASGSALLAASY